MITFLLFPYLAAHGWPDVTGFWLYRGAGILADIIIIAIILRVLIGDNSDEREERRVEALNEAIAHDRLMIDFIEHNREHWHEKATRETWREMEQEEARLRQELNALGGHESI